MRWAYIFIFLHYLKTHTALLLCLIERLYLHVINDAVLHWVDEDFSLLGQIVRLEDFYFSFHMSNVCMQDKYENVHESQVLLWPFISRASYYYIQYICMQFIASFLCCVFFPLNLPSWKSLLQFNNSFPISREEAPHWLQCWTDLGIPSPLPMSKCFVIKEHSFTLHIL